MEFKENYPLIGKAKKMKFFGTHTNKRDLLILEPKGTGDSAIIVKDRIINGRKINYIFVYLFINNKFVLAFSYKNGILISSIL